MLKTPRLSHLSDSDFEDVYEPAEDSYLFLDALENDIDLLRVHLKPAISLEVGCGSGVITSFLAMHLHQPCAFLCTDLNPLATEAAIQTFAHNSPNVVDCIACDLSDPILDRLAGMVDIILFNPPYVATSSDEVASSLLATAWAGGLKGREVTDRFLPQVGRLLSPTGWFYLLLCSENDPDDLFLEAGSLGLSYKVVASRRAGCERLQVVRFFWEKTGSLPPEEQNRQVID